LRIDRTCLRDALPVEVQATGNGEASALERCARDLEAASSELLAVPLGATAVGTGFGAPEGYKELAVRYLAEESGLAVTPVEDPYDALSHLDKFIAVASHLVRSALAMAKIAADLRILSSGPLGGIDEVELPTVQVGSSIMPGKMNPVMPELVMQVSFEVRGTAAIVEAAAASGELELNVMEPVVARPARRLAVSGRGAPLRRSMRLRARMAGGRSRRASLQLIRRSRRTCTTRRLRSRIRVLAGCRRVVTSTL
jgi:aspartate ammonia-lyase